MLGKLLSPLRVLAGYSFEREFEHYTVRVNCTVQNGTFTPAVQTDTSTNYE